MSVANAYALLSMEPTRWSPPLPSHRYHFYGVSTVGDGSGGVQPILLRIMTDAPLNVPPASLEDYWLAADDTVHAFQVQIMHGGGIFDSIYHYTVTPGILIGSWSWSQTASMADFPGKSMIRPRQPGEKFQYATLAIFCAVNINGKTSMAGGWGYIWQIPESIEPWHPKWGSPPAFKSL